MEDSNVQEQAAEAGDVLADFMSGHTVSVIPQEDIGATETIDENKEAKDWRKSDKEWQEAQEKAKRGESAAQQLEKIKAALAIEDEPDQELDVAQALTEKVSSLEEKISLIEWEKSHPAVDTAEYREAWADKLKSKGHLVKSGDLSYDDLWDMVRKNPRPSTSSRDFKEQELNIGSIPIVSKTTSTGSEIDPDVYAAMKRKGFTDEQIRLSA